MLIEELNVWPDEEGRAVRNELNQQDWPTLKTADV
jgi:hypothetical protein